MEINKFVVINDKLLEQSEGSKVYTGLDSVFSFFSNLIFICPKILKKELKNQLKNILMTQKLQLFEECLRFKQFLNKLEIEESN